MGLEYGNILEFNQIITITNFNRLIFWVDRVGKNKLRMGYSYTYRKYQTPRFESNRTELERTHRKTNPEIYCYYKRCRNKNKTIVKMLVFGKGGHRSYMGHSPTCNSI